MSKEIKEIKIIEIFNDKYVVPIYQRKYSWADKEIEQLLEDIINNENNDKYFLGTLTVDKKEDGKYEVIDGQQRLTTLCLIMIYLEKNIDNMLSFEAREIYDNALNNLKNMKENKEIFDYEENVKEIYEGYRCIENYFKNNNSNLEDNFFKKLENIYLVRVQVPKNTDLNHYFEIMNTRGEQLELHHIAKAKFLNVITDNDDKKIASIIWDACSQMNKYMQIALKSEIRKELFKEDLSDFKRDVLNWNTLRNIFNNVADNEDTKKLEDIIKDGECDKKAYENNNNKDENPERFESIITFPYFLLHVNAVLQNSSDEDSLYDDKKLLNNLEKHYENEENAKKFISDMLKCRFLFDKYIVKRDYQDDDNNLELSLLTYTYNNGNTYLINTYGGESGKLIQEPLKVLQSLLRITYTSPRTMKWITILLKHLFDGKDAGLESVTSILENYCIEKIKKFYINDETKEFTEEDFNKKTGFGIERIVFTYLDYLLYRDGYKDIIKPKFNNWRVPFRNSVEHFFPQNPSEEERWDEYLNCFGNLALVTVSGNSKFSNLNPKAKVEQYKDKDIIKQNPKLMIMAKITEMEGWTEKKAQYHQEEMFKILSKEINGKTVK